MAANGSQTNVRAPVCWLPIDKFLKKCTIQYSCVLDDWVPGYKIATSGALARTKVKLYYGKTPCGRYDKRDGGSDQRSQPDQPYLRNVICKFVQTDDKTLLPVLGQLLQLSPTELEALQTAWKARRSMVGGALGTTSWW